MRILGAIILLLAPFLAFAYEPTRTHPGLTEQVVEFYNLYSPQKISDEQKEFIIKGSTDEDDPATRALGHFYDPVRNIGIEGGRTAKEWVFADVAINEYSWGDALAHYAKGEEKEAFIALGHVLHLVEDMGVPDHTRNDQHLPISETWGGKSPYEEWVMENKDRGTLGGLARQLAGEGVLAKRFSRAEEYFDFLANYSNKNFFSRDTIESGVYFEPKIIDSDEKYFYGKDALSGKNFALFGLFPNDEGRLVYSLNDKADHSILSSYFDRLARQIIPSGAGIIELFFKEGEIARAEYLAELRKKQEAEILANTLLAETIAQKGFLGLVWSGLAFILEDNLVTPLKQYVLRPVGGALSFGVRATVQEASVAGGAAAFATVSTASATKDIAVSVGQAVAERAKEALVIVQKTLSGVSTDSLAVNASNAGAVVPQKENTPSSIQQTIPVTVVIGPAVSGPVDVLRPKLVFVGDSVLSGPVSSAGDSRSGQVLGATEAAKQEEKAVLGGGEVAESTGAALAAPVLSAAACSATIATDGCLVATTTVRFEWEAQSGTEYYFLNKNGAFATTTDVFLEITTGDFSDFTLEVAAVDNLGIASATSTKTVSVATIPVAINEIAWAGTVASTNDEWFELKNNTKYTIDLSQWLLFSGDGAPAVHLLGLLKPSEYIVLERTDDETISDTRAYHVYTGALSNSGEQLFLSREGVIFDQTPAGAWVAGENSTTSRKTMERYASKSPGGDAANWMTWGTGIDFMLNGSDANGNAIEGTPGEKNSVSYLINRGADITEDTTISADDGPYVVPRSVSVSASSTLVIEAGTQVLFYKPAGVFQANLEIDGSLEVRGTLESPVVFTSLTDNPAGSLEIRGDATSTITSAYFYNTEWGVNVYGGVVDVQNSAFVGTENEAIGVYGGARVSVASSTISQVRNADAIGVYDSTLFVASTTISTIYDGSGIGAYDSVASVASSTIRDTAEDAILLLNTDANISGVVVEGSEMSESSGVAIYGGSATLSEAVISGFGYGAGVSVTSPGGPVGISGGEISGNAVGVTLDSLNSASIAGVSMHDNEEDIVVPENSVQ